MIRQIFFCLTISLSACGQKSTVKGENANDIESITSKDSLEIFSMTIATHEEFSKAKNKYKDQLVQDTLKMTKKNGVIVLPLQDPFYSPSVIFTDTLGFGEEERREYHYLGQYPDLNLYLVAGSFWEHYECYLVNKEMGNTTVLWNNPKISPSSEYLANLSMPYGLEGIPNGIQIWKYDKAYKAFIKIFELDQQIWAPEDFVWENETTLIMKVISVEKFWASNGEVNEKDFYYLRLKLK